MDVLILLAVSASVAIWVVTLIKFFEIASDVKSMRAESASQTRYLEAISVNLARLAAKRKRGPLKDEDKKPPVQ
jgi:hypothetical protein